MIVVSSEGISSVTTSDASVPLSSNALKANWDMYWSDENVEKHPDGPSVALRELLEEHRWLLPKGRCLLAGCGNGHDAVFLAKRGVPCVAIDFCSAAIEKAQKISEEAGISSFGNLTFAVQDFFTFQPTMRFTVAYERG
ncbi:hypothetical protein J3B02_005324, partial [Coemansia erecta]